MQVKIEPSWQKALQDEFDAPYFKELTDFVRREYQTKTILPKPKNIFKALDSCPLSEVKVVILGQDPYHNIINGQEQAQGLSFAVPKNFPLPPSLQNIFKELSSDLGRPLRKDGDLSDWVKQGVLLLNASLTVEAHRAGSHQGRGWEKLTDKIIELISKQNEHVAFILWGNYARSKAALIDSSKHLIIESVHPSPLSASRGFFGSRPFSRTNQFLEKHRLTPINW